MKKQQNIMIVPTLLALGVVFFLVSCSGVRMYRSKLNNGSNQSCENHLMGKQLPAVERKSTAGLDYLLGFIEFDDQGQLWCREQMKAVLAAIEEETNKPAGAKIIVYAHGWKHNAHEGDTDIEKFVELLEQLTYIEDKVHETTKVEKPMIIGIYLGWRGNSIPVPGLRNVTFWGRKNTAQKVGSLGATEVFSRIEKIQMKANKCEETSSNPTGECSRRVNLIVIGHSFGAALVYSALSDILENRFIHSEAEKDKMIKGFGDLVILMNPAMEANLFTVLNNMSAEKKSYNIEQPVLMTVLTSKGDYPTKIFFKMGRTVSTIFEPHGQRTYYSEHQGKKLSVSQTETNRVALGHFQGYISDSLQLSETQCQPETKDNNNRLVRETENITNTADDEIKIKKAKAAAIVSDYIQRHPHQKSSERTELQDDNSFSRFQKITKKRYGNLILEPKGNIDDNAPYRIIYVDKSIIKGHNDIKNDELLPFFAGIILDTTVSKEKKEMIIKEEILCE